MNDPTLYSRVRLLLLSQYLQIYKNKCEVGNYNSLCLTRAHAHNLYLCTYAIFSRPGRSDQGVSLTGFLKLFFFFPPRLFSSCHSLTNATNKVSAAGILSLLITAAGILSPLKFYGLLFKIISRTRNHSSESPITPTHHTRNPLVYQPRLYL